MKPSGYSPMKPAGRKRRVVFRFLARSGAFSKDKIFTVGFVKIALASVLFQSANAIITVSLPLWLNFLGYPPSVLGVATALSSVAAMIARPVSGAVADKKSKLLVIIPGLAVMALGVVSFSFLPFMAAVIVIRFLQGAGISAATTAQYAIASDSLPDSQIRKGLSYFGVCATIAGAAGPSIGLALIFGDNYTPGWIGSALIFAASIAILSTMTRKGLGRNRRVAVYKSAADAGASEKKGVGRLWGFFEKSAFKPSAVHLAITFANSVINVFLPVYAAEIGVAADIGLFYVVQAITMFVSNVLVGNVIYKARNHYALLLVFVASFAASLVALSAMTGVVSLVVAAALYGFGSGSCTTAVSAVALSSAAADRRGAASATFQAAQDIGYCMGTLFGGIAAGIIGFRNLYAALTALPAIGAVMCVSFALIERRNMALLRGVNVARSDKADA